MWIGGDGACCGGLCVAYVGEGRGGEWWQGEEDGWQGHGWWLKNCYQ